MINRITKLLFLLLITVSVAYAGLTFEFFTGKTNSDGVLIEWKTGDESGTVKFEVERSASTPNSFIFIKSINATGSNSYYSIQDNGVDFLNNPGSASVYYYRLKCIGANGSYSYTNSITVVHTVSGIKNTWGSIKAIFR
jgi:hypothetical protein